MQNKLGFGGGPTFITFLLTIIQMNYMIDIVWFWLVLCEIFYIYHCTLTLFHDSALLPIVKVRSRTHFVYLFVIMTCFWSMIILVSIDFLINCHVCLTLFSRDPFLGTLRGVSVFHRTFSIGNLTFELDFGFSHTVFSK